MMCESVKFYGGLKFEKCKGFVWKKVADPAIQQRFALQNLNFSNFQTAIKSHT